MAGTVEVKVDAKDLSRLYADLKGVEGNLRVGLRRGVKEAATPMVQAVKGGAGFSSRIPGTVRTKASFAARGATVAIEAGGASAPHAAPIDHHGQGGTFWHPVFGNRNVPATQKAHPFFEPGTTGHADQAQTAILRVMDDIARKAGFR